MARRQPVPPAKLPAASPGRFRAPAEQLAIPLDPSAKPPAKRLPVLVSACLVGVVCRWHGKKASPATLIRRYFADHPEAEMVPVCPEMLGGLPTPRPPVKRVKGRVYETAPDKEDRASVTGRDVTAEFHAGAAAAVDIARERGATLALLARWSPSCDKGGIAGKALLAAGVKVENI